MKTPDSTPAPFPDLRRRTVDADTLADMGFATDSPGASPAEAQLSVAGPGLREMASHHYRGVDRRRVDAIRAASVLLTGRPDPIERCLLARRSEGGYVLLRWVAPGVAAVLGFVLAVAASIRDGIAALRPHVAALRGPAQWLGTVAASVVIVAYALFCPPWPSRDIRPDPETRPLPVKVRVMPSAQVLARADAPSREDGAKNRPSPFQNRRELPRE